MEKKSPRDLAEILRDEMVMRDKITGVLEEEPKTVVEIAGELNLPSSEVMQWVMSMRRYGKVIEMPKDRADDYYKYQLRKE
jgi:predicted Rossmann fold nucleotide-binding protein DprA/Smf involved in DNA uptake